MSDDKSKKEILDDFWDISSLVPKKRSMYPSAKSTSTVEIVVGGDENNADAQEPINENTVIKRFIPPHSANEFKQERTAELIYAPENSLIHKVMLYKEKTTYEFYEEFCSMARQLWDKRGTPCEYVDYFSYSPQYNQLSSAQMSYYLWWRENLRQGRYLKTNICYIYLYTYELINAYEMTTPEEARDSMLSVLENYPDILRGVIPRYIRWISDFSLIHKLPPPKKVSELLLKNATSFKEYFVIVPGNTSEGWAKTLLVYCCSYDYKTSKFATGDNLELYDTHIPKALARAIEYLSQSGRILSDLPFGDCRLSAKAFEGALCSSANRYIIEAEYCSFSRSHELRFLVGDIVKYCENKIRARIFVKSKLTIYSLPNDLRDVLDAYFADALPPRPRIAQKKEDVHEYDALYDLPKRKLDLTNAGRIELESWQTTKDLVDAFDQEIEESVVPPIKPEALAPQTVTEDISEEDTSLVTALGEYADAVLALREKDVLPLRELSQDKGKPVEAIVDAINEIAVEVIGDILLEDGEEGFSVIEDYADMLDE